MCELATAIAIAGLVLSAASAATGYVAQKQQASAQRRYQDSLQQAQNQAYLNEATAIRERQAQEHEAAARESQKISKQAREAISTARVASAEAGVAGLSVDALLGDFERQELAQYEYIDKQTQFGDANTERHLEAARLGSYGSQLSTQQPINRPSFLATMIKIGEGAINSYELYKRYKKPDPDKGNGGSST